MKRTTAEIAIDLASDMLAELIVFAERQVKQALVTVTAAAALWGLWNVIAPDVFSARPLPFMYAFGIAFGVRLFVPQQSELEPLTEDEVALLQADDDRAVPSHLRIVHPAPEE